MRMFLLLFLLEMLQKYKTAPKGNNSNTIVKAGKTAKRTFFMLYISFTNIDLLHNYRIQIIP